MSERSYILGTHDAEIDRLALQHRVWRSCVLDLWRDAGIRPGHRILDAGAGPGFATEDLAGIVGPAGHVFGIERSSRYTQHARELCASRGLNHVTITEKDLVHDSLDLHGLDALWCRWVASFVSDVPKLIANITATLRTGGVAIFHEYIDYHTLRLYPLRASFESFVKEVFTSWRDNSGEPDVAIHIPNLLVKNGLTLTRMTPRLIHARPGDYAWHWPKSFIETYTVRLHELGRVSAEWAENVRAEFAQAESDPATLIITPMVLEIVATKK